MAHNMGQIMGQSMDQSMDHVTMGQLRVLTYSLVLLSTGLDTGMHIPHQLLLRSLSDGSLARYSVTKDKIDWYIHSFLAVSFI